MQGSFNVWTDHKKGHNKVKDLARFKPMQRHLFLYTKMLLFCKKREENTDGHEKTASYSFKNSLKVMNAVMVGEGNKPGVLTNRDVSIWGFEEVHIDGAVLHPGVNDSSHLVLGWSQTKPCVL